MQAYIHGNTFYRLGARSVPVYVFGMQLFAFFNVPLAFREDFLLGQLRYSMFTKKTCKRFPSCFLHLVPFHAVISPQNGKLKIISVYEYFPLN